MGPFNAVEIISEYLKPSGGPRKRGTCEIRTILGKKTISAECDSVARYCCEDISRDLAPGVVNAFAVGHAGGASRIIDRDGDADSPPC